MGAISFQRVGKTYGGKVKVIHHHSGKHRHQGGLAIFVLEGAGYTVVDGKRYDWKAGDLILLPIKPGGVSHQHFNADPKKPARWLALITNSYRPHLGYEIVQIEDSPDWKGSWEKSVKL